MHKCLIYLPSIIITLSSISSYADEREQLEVEQKKVFYTRLADLEAQISCNAQYQENESLAKDPENGIDPTQAVQEYIDCLDFLVQKKLRDTKLSSYSVQIIVTPSDAKAKDIATNFNNEVSKNKVFKGLKATYIPFEVPYPGGYKLNDGKYYKVIVGSFKNENEAIKLNKKIRRFFEKEYQDSFVTRVPY